MILGIDLTASERKPTACAALDARGSLAHIGFERTNADILALARNHGAALVAIDAPLGYPSGMCCLETACNCESVHAFKGRACERELIRQGIRLYITTKRSFIKPMIYRAIRLAAEFEAMGCAVIEVYPHATKALLWGKPVPNKSSAAGKEFAQRRLRRLIPGFRECAAKPNHDLHDALIAAYTGYLHTQGATDLAGVATEGQIALPKS